MGKNSKVPLDKIIPKIAALGIPGLVLVVVMVSTGLTGAAAITSALAIMGGPVGILGGLVVLGVAVLLSKGLAEYGFEPIFTGVISELVRKGKTKEEILKSVSEYPISQGLKDKLAKETERFFSGRKSSES